LKNSILKTLFILSDLNSVSLDFVVKHLAADAEALGGFDLVATDFHQLAFHFETSIERLSAKSIRFQCFNICVSPRVAEFVHQIFHHPVGAFGLQFIRCKGNPPITLKIYETGAVSRARKSSIANRNFFQALPPKLT
jgi:hypothetical protein